MNKKGIKRTSSTELSGKHLFSLRRQMKVVNHTLHNIYIILTVDPDTLVLRGIGGNVGAGVGTNPLTVMGGKLSGGANMQMGTSSVPPQVQGLGAGEKANLYMTSGKAYLSVLSMSRTNTKASCDVARHGDLLIHNRLVRYGNVFHVLAKHVQQPVQRDVEYDISTYSLTRAGASPAASNAPPPWAQAQQQKLTEPPAPMAWSTEEPTKPDAKPDLQQGAAAAQQDGARVCSAYPNYPPPSSYYQQQQQSLYLPPSAYIPSGQPTFYNGATSYPMGKEAAQMNWTPAPAAASASADHTFLSFPEPLPSPSGHWPAPSMPYPC
jgi:hypothetical protein